MANGNIAIINNYAAGQAHAEINKMIREYGTIAVLRYATNGKALEDSVVVAETSNGKKIEVIVPKGVGKLIDVEEYGGIADWKRYRYESEMKEDGIENIVKGVCAELDLGIYEHRSSGSHKSMCITHKRFAEYIVKHAGRETLMSILNIIRQCHAWVTSRGVSRFKMEMVYQILMLHQEEKEAVEKELIKIFKNYDPESLKVTANQDDDFRNTLNYEAKMISWVEKQVCIALNLERKFEVAA